MVKTYSYGRDGETFITPHFQIGEFKSFCDDWGRLTTDEIKIDDRLPLMLEKLYDYLDKKYGIGYIYITSGYRNYEFEMYIAGFTGYHYEGKAADIMCYDKNYNLINGSLVACACQTVGFMGIGYIGNAVHCDVRDNISWFDESRGNAIVTDFYDYFGITKPEPIGLPLPVNRDITKIQIEVIEPELYCRLGHDTLSQILGFIPLGIYNFIQYYEDGVYTWYEVEDGKWIANNGEWIKILNIESILSNDSIDDVYEIQKEDEKTNENKKNSLILIIKRILEIIKKIFSK